MHGRVEEIVIEVSSQIELKDDYSMSTPESTGGTDSVAAGSFTFL